jgi:hypothetical protein
VRSESEKQNNSWEKIRLLSTKCLVLPNLASKYNQFTLPAHAVTRNYSAGLSLLHEKVDYIVMLLGDTLIYNPKPLHKAAKKMMTEKKYLCCSKAYGQYFNSKESTSKNIITNRFQGEDTTDFLPQLFIIRGNLFEKTKCFTKIQATNEFTSEQCLGDETLRYFSKKTILSKTILLNAKNPTFGYSFTDGITYHAVWGKPGR